MTVSQSVLCDNTVVKENVTLNKQCVLAYNVSIIVLFPFFLLRISMSFYFKIQLGFTPGKKKVVIMCIKKARKDGNIFSFTDETFLYVKKKVSFPSFTLYNNGVCKTLDSPCKVCLKGFE